MERWEGCSTACKKSEGSRFVRNRLEGKNSQSAFSAADMSTRGQCGCRCPRTVCVGGDGKGLRASQASGRQGRQGDGAPGAAGGCRRSMLERSQGALAADGTGWGREVVLGPGLPAARLQAAFYQLDSRGRHRTEQNLAKLCRMVALARTPSLLASGLRGFRRVQNSVFPPKNCAGSGECTGRRIVPGPPEVTAKGPPAGRWGARSFPAHSDSVDARCQAAAGAEAPGCAASRRGTAYLLRVGHGKGHEGLHGHHPWRDGGSKTLPKERPKRDILPLLNVPSCKRRANQGLQRLPRASPKTPFFPPMRRTATLHGALASARLPGTTGTTGNSIQGQGQRSFEVTVPGYSKENDDQRAGRHSPRRGLEVHPLPPPPGGVAAGQTLPGAQACGLEVGSHWDTELLSFEISAQQLTAISLGLSSSPVKGER